MYIPLIKPILHKTVICQVNSINANSADIYFLARS